MVIEELKIQYSRNENVTYQEMNPFLFEWHLGLLHMGEPIFADKKFCKI